MFRPSAGRATGGSWMNNREGSAALLDAYLANVNGLSWSAEGRTESLGNVLKALDDAALRKLDNYRRRTRSLSALSYSLVILGFLCISAAAIVPLTNGLRMGNVALGKDQSLLFMAVGVTLFGLDRLLSITKTSVRGRIAQVALERLVVDTHIKWCRLMACAKDAKLCDDHFAEALATIHCYCKAIYDRVAGDMEEWGNGLLAGIGGLDEQVAQEKKTILDYRLQALGGSPTPVGGATGAPTPLISARSQAS